MEPREPPPHSATFQIQQLQQQPSPFNYLPQLRYSQQQQQQQQQQQPQQQQLHQQQQHQLHQQQHQHQQQQQQQQQHQQLLAAQAQPQPTLQIQHQQQQVPPSQQQQPSPNHQQQHQQQQQPLHQPQPQTASRNPLLPSVIHTPSAVRFPSPNSASLNPNPNPNPAAPGNPNSASATNPYTPETPPHMIQHQLLSASSPPSGMAVSTAMVLSRSDPVKRKRGRPRKYTTDANGAPLALSPLRVNAASPREKKVGRAPGKKAQLSSLGSTGQGFTPHVLSIGSGEDVAEKITAFSQHGPWALCILSANGAISNASLWHGGTSTGAVAYEGRYELLSLSGLFLLTETGGRTGGLSVSLACPDGKVIGGRVAGNLRAASPIQVVVGTFFSDTRKAQPRTGNGSNAPYIPSISVARHPSMSIEPTHMDAPTDLQDPISGPLGGADKEEHRVSHVMPLQSADWGGSHFDVESRGHNEQIQSHGGS